MAVMEWRGRLSILTFQASILFEFCLLEARIYTINLRKD